MRRNDGIAHQFTRKYKMKRFYLHVLVCLLAAFTACKKDSGTFNTGELVGKWHETKLNLHQTTGNVVIKDTTFTEDSFTDVDFYQFNSDKTAVISKSGNFSFAGKSIILNADVLFDFVTHYTYSAADTTLALTVIGIPADITLNSNGEPYNQLRTIVQLDSNHLILRTLYDYSSPPSASQGLQVLTKTTYFTKEK